MNSIFALSNEGVAEMDTFHLAKQPRNRRPMDQATRDHFIRATIDPLRRDFSSGLLTSVAGVYMPSNDAPYRAGHFIHIENDDDRQKLIFSLEMLLAILPPVSEKLPPT
jgi:hypothetical protein